MENSLNILYFSWVKERIGRDEDTFLLPDNVSTINQLLNHLRELDPIYKDAFEDEDKLRFALDQDFVKIDAAIDDAKELAIFPPVTGG